MCFLIHIRERCVDETAGDGGLGCTWLLQKAMLALQLSPVAEPWILGMD